MSNAEIPAELPKLQAAERQQVFLRLCEVQEADLLNGVGPTAAEMALLDRELPEFERDGDRCLPWREVMRNLRSPCQA